MPSNVGPWWGHTPHVEKGYEILLLKPDRGKEIFFILLLLTAFIWGPERRELEEKGPFETGFSYILDKWKEMLLYRVESNLTGMPHSKSKEG